MGGGGGEVVECGSEVLVRVLEGVAGHDLIVLEHAFESKRIVAAQGPFGAWLGASDGGLSAILRRGALAPVGRWVVWGELPDDVVGWAAVPDRRARPGLGGSVGWGETSGGPEPRPPPPGSTPCVTGWRPGPQ
ncbi:hypothetical protein GCM10017691_44520 [Pseudonocardia petroleophila]